MKSIFILAVTLPAFVALLILLRIIHASRRSKLIVRNTPIIGLVGIAETDLNHEGLVLLEDQIWRATTADTIKQGARVRVVGTEGVLLKVERA